MALGFTSHYNHKSDFSAEAANSLLGVSDSEETTGSVASNSLPSLLSANEGDVCAISAFVPLKIDPSLFAEAPDTAETTGSIAYSGDFSSGSSSVSSSGGSFSAGFSGGGFSSGSSCSFSC